MSNEYESIKEVVIMIADKYCTITILKHKDTLCAEIYLDKEALRTLQAHIFSEIRDAASPEDFTDSDDMLDRAYYINDLAESLNIIRDAINEIEIKEGISNIPPDDDDQE